MKGRYFLILAGIAISLKISSQVEALNAAAAYLIQNHKAIVKTSKFKISNKSAMTYVVPNFVKNCITDLNLADKAAQITQKVTDTTKVTIAVPPNYSVNTYENGAWVFDKGAQIGDLMFITAHRYNRKGDAFYIVFIYDTVKKTTRHFVCPIKKHDAVTW